MISVRGTPPVLDLLHQVHAVIAAELFKHTHTHTPARRTQNKQDWLNVPHFHHEQVNPNRALRRALCGKRHADHNKLA